MDEEKLYLSEFDDTEDYSEDDDKMEAGLDVLDHHHQLLKQP